MYTTLFLCDHLAVQFLYQHEGPMGLVWWTLKMSNPLQFCPTTKTALKCLYICMCVCIDFYHLMS